MKEIRKIAFANLLILLAYSIAISAIADDPYHVGLAFGMLVCLNIHTIVLIILAVNAKKTKNSHLHRVYGISIGLLWLIGLSTCFGIATW